MSKNFQNKEFEEILSYLSYYDNSENIVPTAILEDINEEVHVPGFLKLISDGCESGI